jgi:3-oxoacyl-[acyl-carrier-protein] synthase-3
LSHYHFPEPISLRKSGDGSSSGVDSAFARIIATASALPERSVSNQELVDAYHPDIAADAIRKMVGVHERRVAERGVIDSDLLCEAARSCLEKANTDADGLSKLIVTKFIGDRLLPMTAAFLQRELGTTVAVQSLDVDGGVHGFVHAVDVAVNSIAGGDGPVLVVSGGVINCAVSRTDPRLAFLFGDGAAAVLLGPAQEQHILASYSFSNYEFIDHARGGEFRKYSLDANHDMKRDISDLYVMADYKQSMAFVLEAMKVTADHLVEQAGISFADVDLFLMTESHGRLWSAIVQHLGIEPSKTLSLLSKYGNTMSAMLPLLLHEAMSTDRLLPGQIVMFLSVGEGVTGGGMVIRI